MLEKINMTISCKRCWAVLNESSGKECLKCGFQYDASDPTSYYTGVLTWYNLFNLHLIAFLFLVIPMLVLFPSSVLKYFVPIVFIVLQFMALPNCQYKEEKKYFITYFLLNELLLVTVLVLPYIFREQ